MIIVTCGVAEAAPHDPADTLQAIFSESISYDNNLFRLPDGVSPTTSDGNTERSSMIRVDSVGFAWDKPYSLQNVRVAASVDHHHYSNHDFLDFNSVNGSFAWNWSLTPHLTGVISADRSQTLNSFTDFRNQTTRNLRTNEAKVATADYEALGSWHLIAALIDYSSVSDDTSSPVEDAYRSHGTQAGLKYLFASGSNVSILERRENGEYPGAQPAALIDSEFDQRAHEVQLVWVASELTTLNGRLTHTERTHPNFSQRDFSGTGGRFVFSWKLTGKTSLVASIGRDLTTFQTVYSNYIQSDTVSIAPVWQITDITALKARLSRSWRDYRGQPFGPVPLRSDDINSAQLEFDWQAARNISLGLLLQHDRRQSSYTGFDFKDTTATLNLRLAF